MFESDIFLYDFEALGGSYTVCEEYEPTIYKNHVDVDVIFHIPKGKNVPGYISFYDNGVALIYECNKKGRLKEKSKSLIEKYISKMEDEYLDSDELLDLISSDFIKRTMLKNYCTFFEILSYLTMTIALFVAIFFGILTGSLLFGVALSFNLFIKSYYKPKIISMYSHHFLEKFDAPK